MSGLESSQDLKRLVALSSNLQANLTLLKNQSKLWTHHHRQLMLLSDTDNSLHLSLIAQQSDQILASITHVWEKIGEGHMLGNALAWHILQALKTCNRQVDSQETNTPESTPAVDLQPISPAAATPVSEIQINQQTQVLQQQPINQLQPVSQNMPLTQNHANESQIGTMHFHSTNNECISLQNQENVDHWGQQLQDFLQEQLRKNPNFI